jgi:hypothetical protein
VSIVAHVVQKDGGGDKKGEGAVTKPQHSGFPRGPPPWY